MVDPSGWRVERGGSNLGLTDPSNFNPSVSPIAFDNTETRQPGQGTQSLEFDPKATGNRDATGVGVLIDESSDADQPMSVQCDFCFTHNGGGDQSFSAGLVFAFQDADNYLIAEAMNNNRIDRQYAFSIGEVSSGTYNTLRGEEYGGTQEDLSTWHFARIQAYGAGANDLRVRALEGKLADFQNSGESALNERVNERYSGLSNRAGSVGVGYSHHYGSVIPWLDGIELYWD